MMFEFQPEDLLVGALGFAMLLWIYYALALPAWREHNSRPAQLSAFPVLNAAPLASIQPAAEVPPIVHTLMFAASQARQHGRPAPTPREIDRGANLVLEALVAEFGVAATVRAVHNHGVGDDLRELVGAIHGEALARRQQRLHFTGGPLA